MFHFFLKQAAPLLQGVQHGSSFVAPSKGSIILGRGFSAQVLESVSDSWAYQQSMQELFMFQDTCVIQVILDLIFKNRFLYVE